MKKKFGKPLVILLAFCMILACVPVYANGGGGALESVTTIRDQQGWDIWAISDQTKNIVEIEANGAINMSQPVSSGVKITIKNGTVTRGPGEIKGSLFVEGGTFENHGIINSSVDSSGQPNELSVTGGTFTNRGVIIIDPVKIDGGKFVSEDRGSVESLELTSGTLEYKGGTIGDIIMTGGTVTNNSGKDVELTINGVKKNLAGGGSM